LVQFAVGDDPKRLPAAFVEFGWPIGIRLQTEWAVDSGRSARASRKAASLACSSARTRTR
jgi:hypothetical protein